MSLDALYGAGAAEAFKSKVDLSALFPGSTVGIIEGDCDDGTVAVETTWRDSEGHRIALYRLVYSPTVVFCSWLQVEPSYLKPGGSGVLTQLMRTLEPWWPTLGLTANTMSVRPGSLGELALESCGFGPLEDGGWGCTLPADRLREYLEWVDGGEVPADEPAWRKALAPPPPVF